MRKVASSLIGRELELSRLLELLEDARLGLGGASLLLGEAGIGKSSLADSVAREALDAGFLVAWGQCSDRDLGPYAVWRQVLGGLGGEVGGGALDSGRSGSRDDLYVAVVEAVERAASSQPVLVVLDDVHRADEGSLDLLDFIAGQLRGTRILLLVAARDDPLELPVAAANALARLPSEVVRLDLSGLELSETEALVRAVLGDDADAQLVRDVHQRTGGNPFFASEVARLHAMQPGHAGAVALPTAVQHVLSRRFARLDQMAHHLLDVAAVTGTPDVSVLAAVIGATEAAVLKRLDEAVASKLLVRSGGRLQFAHDLVRETLYAGLGAQAKARLHRATAESGVVVDPASLAHHWAHADGPDAWERAAEQALLAGHAAMASRAYGQAVRFYRWALDAEVGDRLVVSRCLGEATVLSGGIDEGRSLLRETAELALAADHPQEALTAVLAMGTGPGGFEVDVADLSQVGLIERALEAMSTDDSGLRAAGMARLSLVRTQVASVEERAELAQRAVGMAVRVLDGAAEAAALAAVCDALSGPDHVRTRLGAADRMLTVAQHAGDTALTLLALRLRLVARLEGGDLAGVDADIAAYERRAARLRLPVYTWPIPLWRGMRAVMDGDLSAAQRYADETAALGAEAGSANAGMMAWALRLAMARRTREPEAFNSLLVLVGEWAIPAVQWDCAGASIAAHAGRTDEARLAIGRVMSAGLETIAKDSEYLELLWLLGEAAILLGEHETAVAVREALSPYPQVWAVDGLAGACFGPVSDILAALDDFLGAGEPSAPAVTESASLRREGKVWHVDFRGVRRTVAHSKGLLDLAELLSRPGRDIPALDLVEAAGGVPRALAGGDTGPVLDAQARTAYRSRIAELDDELDEATAHCDQGRIERLGQERDFLLAELAGALGLGGRNRMTGDPAERARKTVTMRIGTALRAIGEVHQELARHLRASIATGRLCAYRPEHRVDWHVERS